MSECNEHCGLLREPRREDDDAAMDGGGESGGGADVAAMDEDVGNGNDSRAPVFPRHHLLLDGEIVYLNLRIQRFVERLRVVDAPEEALADLNDLTATVNALPATLQRTYTTELERVAGLLAFSGDAAPIQEYCSPARRSALARQVNSAILAHDGLPTQSLLELVVRQTSNSWRELHDRGVNVPEGHPLYAMARLASVQQPDEHDDATEEPSVLPLWTVRDL